MAERKLATVEEILAIEPIENADALELATVRGWGVVVRKDEFSVGDKVVYFEIDSFLDVERQEFSFLKDRGTRPMNDPEDEKKKIYGHALRTIKLRGQISQGLVLPMSEFPKFVADQPVGTDLTDNLGVLKYEPYVKPQGGPRRLYTFPTKYAVKSDAERVQNLSQRQWSSLQDIPGWYATLKIDGQSVTYFKDDEGALKIATRNYEIVNPISPTFPPYEWLWSNWDTIEGLLEPGNALQGELYGPSIQGNKMGIKELKFAPFNFFYYASLIPREEWYPEFEELAVPTLDVEFPETIKEAVDQANDLRYPTNGSQAEGIVWHNSDPEVAKVLGRNCFKSINQKFLLKNEK